MELITRTAAAYIRTSTDDQMEVSPDSQLGKIREWAEAHGYDLPDHLIFREEEGVSDRMLLHQLNAWDLLDLVMYLDTDRVPAVAVPALDEDLRKIAAHFNGR